MPSIETHKLFGRSVLNKNKINLDLNLYDIFNQSFDNFVYYKFFSPIKSKDSIFLKKYGHRLHTRDYLINIAKNIKNLNLHNDKQCLAYLYGSINHYVLDSTFHPFVFYKTGIYLKKKKETLKYNSMHTKMEFMLDCYFYEKINNMPFYKYKIFKYDFPKVKFNDNLIKLMDKTIKDTFEINNASRFYINGIKTGRFIFKHAVYDPYGIKKTIYKLIDFLPGKKRKKCEYISSHVKNIDSTYLNLEHKIWYHPCTKEPHNTSVDDLFNEALKTTTNYYKYFKQFLDNEINENDLNKLILNVSYINGLDINKKYKWKCFEY